MSENLLIENVKSGGKLKTYPENPVPIFQVLFCPLESDKEPAGAAKKADNFFYTMESLGKCEFISTNRELVVEMTSYKRHML